MKIGDNVENFRTAVELTIMGLVLALGLIGVASLGDTRANVHAIIVDLHKVNVNNASSYQGPVMIADKSNVTKN